MVQEGSEITALSDACYNAWNRYCEDIWCKNDTLKLAFSEGFDEGLNWTYKELTWVLQSKSKKEFIERINKLQNDIKNYCVIR